MNKTAEHPSAAARGEFALRMFTGEGIAPRPNAKERNAK